MLVLALRTGMLFAALALAVMVFAGEVLVTGIILVAAAFAGVQALLARIPTARADARGLPEGGRGVPR